VLEEPTNRIFAQSPQLGDFGWRVMALLECGQRLHVRSDVSVIGVATSIRAIGNKIRRSTPVEVVYDQACRGGRAMTLERGTDDNKPKHWRVGFGGIRRNPRPWNSAVAALLENSWPVTMFLRESKTTTDIVLRLPISSRQLSDKDQKAFFEPGISIKAAFEDIIWTAPKIGDTSPWARIAWAGYDAYWAAWIHLLKVVYRHQSWPEMEAQQIRWRDELTALKKSTSLGRRGEVEAERKSLSKRSHQLLRWCEGIHKVVRRCNDDKLSDDQTRKEVFKRIYRQRNAHYVLSGKAFEWSLNRKRPVLHDARSWTPRELAPYLLALERDQEYATIARKLGARPIKKQSR
jgi:hypothetical protein